MRKIFTGCSVMLTCMVMALSAAAQGITRDVSDYYGVECNGPFNVQVKIDGTESVRLDVDAGILNDIETKVDNGVLKVQMKHGWRNHGDIARANIYITAKELHHLANGGSGNMVLEGTVTGPLAILTLSGSGSLKASVKSELAQIKLSGSGGLTVDGSADRANVQISGSGNVNAIEFTVQTLNARLSGSGSVDMVVNKKITAVISGSGGVAYTGDAAVADTQYSGSGRVSKKD
ncbi:head GIN domain-containing protein [Mucilaginibacter sp. L3T2-6]|uniref:head GIN domain-containing protein n=1 Tax=Mucilaginibacter sp. L3T2-6 TaxID=3062491 RepID=UPI0026761A0D|nr:head GIN domain-containing protein [Mucilaginibacter sp. L3T2-6]MDO3641425.1 head GIN domain-containing protein [Mucilaginibacter sp. L3T2-6]MDV6213814.1 head GIN domain-containing protein [Mucilaginibacter sp. L3T2-6]